MLDMAERVKIVDLADTLIEHHRSDAEIVFTGLRPNEQLHEVLGHEGESMATAEHARLWRTDLSAWTDDLTWTEEQLDALSANSPEALMARSTTVSLVDKPSVRWVSESQSLQGPKGGEIAHQASLETV